MDIKINLLRDLADAVRQQMALSGYDVASVENDDPKALIAWHKLSRYKIARKPRLVFKADGFDPLGHEVGLSKLEEAIRNGDDLSIYMTSRLSEVTARDGLFDHWGICHFHLGTEIDSRTGRIKRTRDILLCRIDDNHAYFIKVAPHGSDAPAPWYQQELLEILHNNWPWSIEFARVKGATDVKHEFNDDEIRRLRDVNVTVLLKVADGVVYVEPGMGTTGDGTHIDDLTFANRVSRAIGQIEKHIVEDYASVKDKARRLGYHLKKPVSLELRAAQFGVHWDIIEPQTNYWFRIDEPDVRRR